MLFRVAIESGNARASRAGDGTLAIADFSPVRNIAARRRNEHARRVRSQTDLRGVTLNRCDAPLSVAPLGLNDAIDLIRWFAPPANLEKPSGFMLGMHPPRNAEEKNRHERGTTEFFNSLQACSD